MIHLIKNVIVKMVIMMIQLIVNVNNVHLDVKHV